MFNLKYQYKLCTALTTSLFINIHASVIASTPDECTDIDSLASSFSNTSILSEQSRELSPLPRSIESALEKILCLSQKEGIHKITSDFRRNYTNSINACDQYNIVLGTGLKCKNTRSNGIPFDVLGFIASAEAARKTFGFAKIIHFIGDANAALCEFNEEGFRSRQELQEEAVQQKFLYEAIALKLGLENSYEVLLNSTLQELPEYKTIKEDVFPREELKEKTPYTKLQIADTQYFKQHRNVLVKFSWVMHEEEGKKADFDETSYDKLYKDIYGKEALSFLYAKSGIKLNLKGFSDVEVDSCPYSYPATDNRITLRPRTESVEEVLEGFSKHLFDKAEKERTIRRKKIFKIDIVQKELQEKVLNKYQSIVDTVLFVFPDVYYKSDIDDIDSLAVKIEKIMNYILD